MIMIRKTMLMLALVFSGSVTAVLIDSMEAESIIRDVENIFIITKRSKIDNIIDLMGTGIMIIDDVRLQRFKLPKEIYPDLDHSSFQPYMDYRAVTNKKSGAYKLINHEDTYLDEYGFKRKKINQNQFSVYDDDYIVALGNYYKTKGVVGDRFLVITSTGMYTIVVGDEKSNTHTNETNMFTMHGKRAGVIEWIVDTKKICKNIKRHGTVTAGEIIPLQGELLHIYKIT